MSYHCGDYSRLPVKGHLHVCRDCRLYWGHDSAAIDWRDPTQNDLEHTCPECGQTDFTPKCKGEIPSSFRYAGEVHQRSGVSVVVEDFRL